MQKNNHKYTRKWVGYVLALLLILQLLPIQAAADMSAGANVILSAKVMAGASEGQTGTVLAGQEFRLVLTYTFYPLEEGNAYRVPNIWVPLPSEDVAVITKDDLHYENGQVNKAYISEMGNYRYAVFELADVVGSGEAKEVSITGYFPNMTTANGTVARFDGIYIKGAIANDTTGTRDDFQVDIPAASAPAVTCQAQDEWAVTKSVLDYPTGSDANFYYVRYRISTSLANGALYDRQGRLELDAYTLTDILPIQGVPAGGKAEFVSAEAEGIPGFAEGNGYTLQTDADGKLDAITFTRYNTLTQAGSNVPAGTSIGTNYDVTVRYPKAAYATPSNQDLVEYPLTNTAQLDYSLTTVEETVRRSAQATVTLGWYENETDPVSLTVQKQVKIGEETFPLDQSALDKGYGRAGFTLYTDPDCSKVAKDIRNNTVDANQLTDANGRVTFTNLRHGAYYVKETTAPDGFAAMSPNPLKVTIDQDGKVSYGDTTDARQVTVLDEAAPGGMGVVLLTKQGLDAGGATVALPGVAFELRDQEGAVVKSGVTAVDGALRFDAVPAGAYKLVETELPDALKDEYVLLPQPIDVTVQGGDIVAAGSNGVVTNLSPKGKFSLAKVDALTRNPIAGAEFQLYQSDKVTPVGQPFTVGVDGYVSGPLDPGVYFVKETRAPTGYVANDDWLEVTVAQNTITPQTVENQPMAILAVKKYGAWLTIPHYTGLAGVKFHVYTSETGGQPVATLVSAVDATGVPTYTLQPNDQGEVSAIYLEEGAYYLEEDADTVPPGYKANTGRQAVTLTAGQPQPEEVLISNQSDWGRIRVIKREGKNGTPMGGVRFDIYRDAACTDLVETITTAEKDDDELHEKMGEALSSLLPVTGQTYFVKEANAPEDYVARVAVIGGRDALGNGIEGSGLTLTAGEETSVVAFNDPKVVIQIKKTDVVQKDGQDILVAGATFDIYDQEPAEGVKSLGSATTGQDGLATFQGLTPGKAYWFVETTAPDGYLSDATPFSVVAPAHDAVETVAVHAHANTHVATLRIYKHGPYGNLPSLPLAGATFDIYPKSATGDADADRIAAQAQDRLVTATTGEDGYAQATGLTPGDYWVVETAAPAGYARNETPQTVTLLSGDNTLTDLYRQVTHLDLNNQPAQGKMAILKKDGYTGMTLKAAFGVYTTGDAPTRVGEIQTGVDGKGTSGWLEPGVYELREEDVEGNYVMAADAVQVEVKAGETATTATDGAALTFTNTPKRRIVLHKTATWTATTGQANDNAVVDLEGAVFDIFPKSDGEATEALLQADRTAAGDQVQTLQTGADGLVQSDYLAPGDYWVVETAPPTGYDLSQPAYQVATVTQEQDVGVEVSNTPQTGRIRIYKLDQVSGDRLPRARFELYKTDAAGTTEAPDGTRVSLVALQTTMESGEDGTVLSVALEPGDYYVKELADSPLLTKEGYEMVSEWTGPITVTAAQITGQEVFNYKPVALEGRKQDDLGQAVNGAHLALLTNSADAESLNAYLRDHPLAEADITADFMAAYGIDQVAVSRNGVFSFNGLRPGQTYYVVELLAPTGYGRYDGVARAEVNQEGTAFVGGLTVEDIRYGRFQLQKQTTLSGQTFLLDGAVFDIYKATLQDDQAVEDGDHATTDVGCHYTYRQEDWVADATTGTGGAGMFVSVYLAPGDYVVVEREAPTGFSKDDNAYHIKVQMGGLNSYLVDQPVYNEAEYGRFYLRKVDASVLDHRLSATFKLQKLEGDAYVDYPNADNPLEVVTTASGADYLSPYLPAGDYRLVETQTPAGYTGGLTHDFTITRGALTGTADAPMTVKNQPQGELTVVKSGQFMAETATPLQGVAFQLYAWTGDQQVDLAQEARYTALTNSSGVAAFTGIDAGDYWLVEADVGNNPGYSTTTFAPRKVSVDPGQKDVTLEATNPAVWGKLRLTKVDAHDPSAVLSGAVFTLYKDEACTGATYGAIATQADGVGVSGLLEPGLYYAKETTPPSGYFLPEGAAAIYGPFEVKANQFQDAAITLTNVKVQKVVVTKLNSETRQPLSGVSFGLYASLADAQQALNPVDTGVTNAQGECAFGDLQPMTTYYLRELSTPTGYVDHTADILPVTTDNTGEKAVEMKNIPQGVIFLRKTALWLDAEGAQQTLDLGDVAFDVYAADAAGDPVDDVILDTIVTTDQGIGRSKYLDPGRYVLVERPIAGGDFLPDGDNRFTLELDPGEEDRTYVTTPIENLPQKGKFQVHKFAAGDPNATLSGAVFELYVKTGDGADDDAAQYTLYNADNPTFEVTNGVYESGYVPSGKYMVVEVEAPAGYTLDATPHFFTVEKGQTVAISVENDAQGALVLTKQADALNGSAALPGATFQLYKDAVQAGNEVGEARTTDGYGKITWDGLDAGAYYLVETAAPAGFATVGDIPPVTVRAQGVAQTYPVSVTDPANHGRILIKKTNSDGQTLPGAVFDIYGTNALGEPDRLVQQGLTTDDSGFALSDLLPAAAGGTTYLVREVQAPAGYMLDGRLAELEKTVLVQPIHTPLENAEANFVSLTNLTIQDLEAVTGSIAKQTLTTSEHVSLMLRDFQATYALKGYANGQNPLPVERFIVTDNTLALKYYEGGDASKQVVIPQADGDYTFTHLRIYRATDDTGGPIGATVQYQTFEQLGTEEWTSLPESYRVENLQDLAAGAYATINLEGVSDAAIMGVRVLYGGEGGSLGKHFAADGMELDVTFAQRTAGVDTHEVRRVENQANLDFSYTLYDHTHTPSVQPVHRDSQWVYEELPLLEVAKTEVALTNKVQPSESGGTTFVAGKAVKFDLKATNHSADVPFQSPILSVDVAAYTTFNEQGMSGRRFVIADNTGAELTPTAVGYEDVQAMVQDASGALAPLFDAQGAPVMTRRLVFAFEGYTLEPGASIQITYETIINADKPRSVTTLLSPAYLSSAYRLPVSAENPLGLSFENAAQAGGLITVPGLDDAVDSVLDDSLGENQYINANETITVVDDNGVSIVKQVKGPLDADYLNAGQPAYTFPEGPVDYRLTVYNNLTAPAKGLRIVDILPFEGDSYVIRNEVTGAATSRSTELPKRPTLVSVSAPGATVYYCTDERWSNRSGSIRSELPMLYEGDLSSFDGWSTAPPADMSAVTAIAVDVSFAEGSYLPSGERYSMELSMVMPGFTADEIDAFYDKIVANSAAAAFTAAGENDPGWQVENDQVIAHMRLPTGSIGDYAFSDVNNNGLQDAGDLAIGNLPVTLYRTDYLADGTHNSYTARTTTDADGKYLFDDLPCNFLRAGAQAGSTDPHDYVGDVYTVYRVVFGDPGNGFTPTLRYAGNDPELDSNIDANRVVDDLTLNVAIQEDGSLEGSQDLSIDAGFVLPAQLGDRVWVDVDRDGIQGPDEPGVDGVTVNLYRLSDEGALPEAPLATTQTATVNGEAGIYLFQNLVPGQYMVEFDISDLKKEDGATYRYAFTQPGAGVSDVDDSDAAVTVDVDDRIRRTETIALSPGDDDRTWDAGLMVYSALGGYCFDDVNYSDVQDVGVALPGTVVTLYRVTDGVREDAPLRPSQTVGMDGRYYFDGLIEGAYMVHFDFPDRYRAVNPLVGGDITLDSNVEVELSPDLNQGYTRVIELGYDSVDTTWDAGAYLLGDIGDYVWFDANRNGIQDADEHGVGGVRVILQSRQGNDGVWAFYEETATDANGYYGFHDLKGGLDADIQYRVIFDTNLTLTLTQEGMDSSVDSDAMAVYIQGMGYPTRTILLGYGESDLTWDAGLVDVISALGDYVWYDLNENGIQDEEERGVPDVTVVLEHNATGQIDQEDAWAEAARTTTNQAGYYRFDGLTEGYYRIKFLLPEGYGVTLLENAGLDGYAIDSDALPNSRGGWYFTRSIYLEADTVDLTWDAGICPGGASGGEIVTPGAGGSTGDHFTAAAWLLALLTALGAVLALAAKRKRVQ